MTAAEKTKARRRYRRLGWAVFISMLVAAVSFDALNIEAKNLQSLAVIALPSLMVMLVGDMATSPKDD